MRREGGVVRGREEKREWRGRSEKALTVELKISSAVKAFCSCSDTWKRVHEVTVCSSSASILNSASFSD